MKRCLIATLTLLALLLAACGENSDAQKAETPSQTQEQASPARPRIPIGNGFDFYVLSLSWSPTWCADNDRSGRSAQCDRRNDHGFIVHGLWPQNERGYPEDCRSVEPDRVPEGLGRSLFDIMPSMGLIGHEWRKHGTCSGLSQRDYFAVLRAAHETVRIPPDFGTTGARKNIGAPQIEAAFTASNPGLTAKAMSVTCAQNRLDEIRICLTKDLRFRACGEIDRGGCRADNLFLPPIP